MKNSSLAKLSLLAISLTTLMNQNPARAQFDDDIDWGWQTEWQKQNGYVGATPIILREVSPRLQRAMREARAERRKLRQIRQELQPLNQRLERKQQAKRTKKKEWDDAKAAVTSLDTQITRKEKAIQDANGNLPNLEQAVARATQNVQQKRQAKQQAEAQVASANTAVAEAQRKLAALTREYRTWLQQCATQTGKTIQQCAGSPDGQTKQQALRTARTEFNTAKATADAKQSTLDTATEELTRATRRKSAAEKAVTDAKDLIANGSTQLQSLKQRKRAKAQEARAAKTELDTINSDITQIEAQIAPVQRRLAAQRQVVQDAVQNARRIRSNIIDRLMYANREGVRVGQRYGADEGNALAYSLGRQKGTVDGNSAGQAQGVADGEARDYRKGYAAGEIVGEKQAEEAGEADGSALGRTEGNQLAGSREGTADGEARARRSDAAAKGQQAGTVEGNRRAVEDGRRDGTRIGEREAIQERESKRLKSTTISGQFAGIFSQNVPIYPGVQHPSYRDCDSYRREFVRVACRDGLASAYFGEAEIAYNNNISRYYQDAYNAGYRASYDYYFGQAYPNSESAGYSQGQQDKYNAVYPSVKEYYRERAKDQYARNPERNSSAYRSSFQSATRAAYDRTYQAIYGAKFEEYNRKIYDENIQEQTNKYKAIRKSEVTTIYDRHPVIKFNNLEISDGGKNGVGVLDGVFMPEEDMVASVAITNYGKAEATNVKVILDNGSEFVLPPIPGESVVTLKGIAKKSVRGSEGSQESLSVSITKKLWSNEKSIEGKHFYNASTGLLVSNSRKSTQVLYPVQVTGLGLEKPLLLGEEQALIVNLQKRANRTIEGPINIAVSTSLGSVLSNPFPSVNKLTGSKSLNQAKVLVTDESDALKYLTFNADIVKNGVVIGKIGRSGGRLVQVGYKAKENAPVLVGDAIAAPNDLLDSLQELGGIEKVSVIDLALDQGKLLSSGDLSNKTVVFSQRRIDEKARAAAGAILRGNDSNILSVKNTAALRDLLSASVMAYSANETTTLSTIDNGIVSLPNSYQEKDTKGSVVVTGLNPEKAEVLGEAMTMSNSDLLSLAKSAFTVDSLTTAIDDEVVDANARDAVKKVAAKILAEAMMISNIEKVDRKKGKRLRRAAEKDKNDLAVMLGEALDQARKDDDNDAIVSMTLVLEDVIVAMDDIEQFDDMDRDVKNSVKKRFERDLSRAFDSLPRSVRRKIQGRRTYTKLAGNFIPFVERK